MNGKDFLDELAQRTGYAEKDVAQLVATLVNVITEKLQEGEAVALQDFGTLEVEKQMESIFVNHSTGQRFLVPPRLSLRFTPDPNLGNRLNKPEHE